MNDEIRLIPFFDPVLPYDGRWHRWAGRRLAIRLDGGGWCAQKVSLLRWVLRWGGDVPEMVRWKAEP